MEKFKSFETITKLFQKFQRNLTNGCCYLTTNNYFCRNSKGGIVNCWYVEMEYRRNHLSVAKTSWNRLQDHTKNNELDNKIRLIEFAKKSWIKGSS